MRKDYFLMGLGIRLIMLFLFILANQNEVYNDASEIIYLALKQFLNGNNPYSVSEYELTWGESTFTQPFNYGPVTLILYLPAMLIPLWHNNLWIGMTIMINIYSFLIAEYVSKLGSKDLQCQKNAKISHLDKDPRGNQLLYYGGIFFWVIPVGTTPITVFIYGPILLTILAFHQLKKPLLASFLISMAAMSYQLIFLFIPIYFIYYIKQNNKKNILKFIIGLMPAIMLIIIFEIWGQGGIISSLFGYTTEMPYTKCSICNNDFDSWSIFSIPRILYNISKGSIRIGPFARLMMIIILGIICLIYLFTSKFDSFQEFFIIKYIILSIYLFTLTTNYGQSHYLIFLFIPLLYYYQMKKPDFRKNYPIGAGLWTWDDFDIYFDKMQKFPL